MMHTTTQVQRPFHFCGLFGGNSHCSSAVKVNLFFESHLFPQLEVFDSFSMEIIQRIDIPEFLETIEIILGLPSVQVAVDGTAQARDRR